MIRTAPLLLLTLWSCRCGPHEPVATGIDIPRTARPIVADGDTDEVGWRQAFQSPPFEDARGRSTPFTELRATADDANLYLLVYVSDRDLESNGDSVTVNIGPLELVLNPRGGTAPAGVKIGTDIDGTIDDPRDEDEEWVTEIEIPWAMLKTRTPAIRAIRRDVGKDGPPRLFAWPRSAPTRFRFNPG